MLDWTRDNVVKDWSLTAWGTAGDVSVAYTNNLYTTDKMPEYTDDKSGIDPPIPQPDEEEEDENDNDENDNDDESDGGDNEDGECVDIDNGSPFDCDYFADMGFNRWCDMSFVGFDFDPKE